MHSPDSISLSSFVCLFKKYRLLAGFSTLENFSEALQEEGFFIDPTILSRWQSGTRSPSSRRLVLKIISIFVKHDTISSLDEANEFLASTGFGYLTEKECYQYFPKPLTMSLEDKASRIFMLSVVSEDYLKKLQYIEKNPRALTLFIQSEESSLLEVLHESLVQKNMRIIESLWKFLGRYFWETGKWRIMSEYIPRVEGVYAVFSQRLLSQLHAHQAAWLYYWQGNLSMAHRAALTGIEGAKHVRDRETLMVGKVRLGKILQGQKKYDQAIDLFISAQRYYMNHPNPEMIGDILTYIGETYWLKKDFDKAFSYLHKAEKHTKSIKDYPQLAIIRSILSGFFLSTKQLSLSLDYSRKSYEYENSGKRRAGGMFWNMMLQGFIWESKGMNASAKKCFYVAKHEGKYLGMTPGTLRISPMAQGLEHFFTSHAYLLPSHS